MGGWRLPIRCYVSPAENNQIAVWYAGLSKQEQSDADEFIKTLRKMRRWRGPDYRRLDDGIGELRWKSENKQQRLLGFFQDGVWYALIGCKHKQQIYTPQNCLDTAKKRKRQIQNNEVTTVDYDL